MGLQRLAISVEALSLQRRLDSPSFPTVRGFHVRWVLEDGLRLCLLPETLLPLAWKCGLCSLKVSKSSQTSRANSSLGLILSLPLLDRVVASSFRRASTARPTCMQQLVNISISTSKCKPIFFLNQKPGLLITPPSPVSYNISICIRLENRNWLWLDGATLHSLVSN